MNDLKLSDSMNGLLATKKRKMAGMSLIELSVVIVIVGILIYTTLNIGTASTDAEKMKQAEKKLIEIERALTVYYMTNSYLPCPANPTLNAWSSGLKEIPSSATHAGTNLAATTNMDCYNVQSNGPNAPVYIGAVPTSALRLQPDAGIDPWGRKITYAVSRYCVAAGNWSASNDYRCSNGAGTTTSGGNIKILDANATDWMTDPNQRAAYITISHGKNGSGAWGVAGGRITGSGFTAQERDNGSLDVGGGEATASYDEVFRDQPIMDGTKAGKYYDDIVRFRTPAQIDYDATN